MKRFIALLLVFALITPTAFAADTPQAGFTELPQELVDIFPDIIAADGYYGMDGQEWQASTSADSSFGDLYIVYVSHTTDEEFSYYFCVYNLATLNIVVPCIYKRLTFLPNGNVFAFKSEGDGERYYEIDIDGGITTELNFDGSKVAGVDDKGYITLYKAVSVDYTTAEGGNEQGTVYHMALLDSEYNMVLDYVVESAWYYQIYFVEGYAIVKTGSTEWVEENWGLEGNGRYGVINRKGEFVIEPIYEQIAELGNGKFAVTHDKRDYDIVNAYNGEVFSYDLMRVSNWAEQEYDRAIELGLVGDYDSDLNRFRGYNATRQEFCEFAVRLYEALHGNTPIPEDTPPFDDIDLTSMRYDYVSRAYALGIINGKSETVFDPLASITREEAALMLYRLANLLGVEQNASSLEFSDVDDVSPEAQHAISAVSATVDSVSDRRVMGGVGDGKFEPYEPYTVEQAVCTMLRLYNVYAANLTVDNVYIQLWTSSNSYYEVASVDAERVKMLNNLYLTNRSITIGAGEVNYFDVSFRNDNFVMQQWRVGTNDAIYDALMTLFNDALRAREPIRYSPISMTLDGEPFEASDTFRITIDNTWAYYKAEELGELFGMKTVCEDEVVSVYFEDYVTTNRVGDEYIITTKIGSDEVLYFEDKEQPIIFNGEYYIGDWVIADMFFVGCSTVYNEAYSKQLYVEFTTLDKQIEDTIAFADSMGYVYAPSGNIFLDRYTLSGSFIVQTSDGDGLFWFGFDSTMDEFMQSEGKLKHFSGNKYMVAVTDKDGDQLYGLNSGSYNVIPANYSELTCIDYRARFFSVAVGFGDEKRYGGVHMPQYYYDSITFIPTDSKAPLTADYMRDYMLSRGISLEGEYADSFAITPFYTDDLVTELPPPDVKNMTSFRITHPISWGWSYFGADLDIASINGFGIIPDELRGRSNVTRVISEDKFLPLEDSFYATLYPDEQPHILNSDIIDLDGRRVYRYALDATAVDGRWTYYPVHYFIYFFEEGLLFDLTLYADSYDNKYDNALFERIIESINSPALWYR